MQNADASLARNGEKDTFWTKSSGKYFGKAQPKRGSTNGRGGQTHMAKRMKKAGRKHRRGRKSKKG